MARKLSMVDLEHRAGLYGSADTQVRQFPIGVDDTPYPGGGQVWLYRKDTLPVVLYGSIEHDNVTHKPTIQISWVNGMTQHFEVLGALNPVTYAAAWVEWVDHYRQGNMVDANLMATITQVTVGAAAGTLTGAANRNYKVIFASTKNDTRVTAVTCVYTPNGGAATTIVDTGASTVGIGVNLPCVGGQYGTMAALSVFPSHLEPINLQQGDTLVMTQGAYAGGDVVEHNFVAEEWVI